jgi:hypothetical protein
MAMAVVFTGLLFIDAKRTALYVPSIIVTLSTCLYCIVRQENEVAAAFLAAYYVARTHPNRHDNHVYMAVIAVLLTWTVIEAVWTPLPLLQLCFLICVSVINIIYVWLESNEH